MLQIFFENKKNILPILACLFCLSANAQFDKANDEFNKKKYAAAVPLYEAGLKEKTSNLAAGRLAFCYRMLNQTEKAEALYAEVVKSEKAKNDASFFYAEALMSNGKYAEAKTWFLKYHELEPSDSTAFARAAACDLVPNIQPYFRNLKMEEFPFNSEADDNTPAFWFGGLVFTSDRASGAALLKEKSDWTGRDFLKLYFSEFDSSANTFSEPKSFSGKLNELNKNTANASFSKDWETIFFSRNSTTPNKKDEYTLQLFTAERAGNRWKNEEKLDFCKPELNYMHPAATPNGQRVFFASNGGGQGGFDIFTAEKNHRGEWRRVQNLGAIVNTPSHEAFPYFHPDGRLFFCSKGHAGFGGFDVFVTRFDSVKMEWQPPVNLGRPINSSLDDLGFYLAPNDSTGAFTSGRSGGDDDLYLFWLGETKNLAQIFYPKTENQPAAEISETSEKLEIEKKKPLETPISKDSTTQTNQFTNSPISQFPNFPITQSPFSTLDTALQNGSAKTGSIYFLENFKYDSSEIEIPAAAKIDLDSLAVWLVRYPNLKLEITVHTETGGQPKSLFAHSKSRATEIAKYFLEKNSDFNRLKIKGLGGKKPIFDCPKKEDCPPEMDLKNRRVEVKIEF